MECLNTLEVKARRSEKQKAYYEKNKTAISKRTRVYRVENKDTIREKKKQYADEHKEKVAAYQKQYREKNAARLREYDRIRKKTPEIKAARKAAYRAFVDNFVGPKRPTRKHTDSSLRAKRVAYCKSYYERNKDSLIAAKKLYVAANRQAYLDGQRRWREQNVARRTALQAKRDAHKRQAIPSWAGELDGFAWEEAADLVRRRREATGIDWHADHMIPLASRKACGLHVWRNCQVIPAVLNVRKHNKMWLTEPLEWLQYLAS